MILYFTSIYKDLLVKVGMDSCSQVWFNLFSEVRSNRTKGNGLKLHPGRFRWEIRKKNVPQVDCGALGYVAPREVVDSPCLELFKRPVDESLRDRVWWWACH